MRNRYAKGLLCMIFIFSAAAVMGCGAKSVKDSDVIMEIAGQPVVKAEYQMILASRANEVRRQYSTEEANRRDFWTSAQEGGKPLELAMQLAGEELAGNKVIAQLAGEYGMDAHLDYLSLASMAEQENDTRQDAQKSGKAVYGLSSYDMETYYEYAYTQAGYEAAEKLMQEQNISEEELKEIYRENADQYTSAVSVKMLVAEMDSEAGMGKAQQAAVAMETETDPDVLARQISGVRFYELELSDLHMEEGKSGAYMQRWLTASAMMQDEICEPFAIGSNLMVMRCLARTEDAVQPFEEIRNVLESDVRSGLAQEEMERRTKEAKTELMVTEEELEKIALEALQ